MINKLIIAALIIILMVIISRIFFIFILPTIIRKSLQEVNRNPKWITSRLHDQYYGFDNVDIILCNSSLFKLPFFYITKQNRLELWINNDTSINDVEHIGQLLLCSLLKTRYNLCYPEKPLYWQSLLLYMIEGGDINMETKIKNNKPLD